MYEVIGNYGAATFETQDDAINALFLLGGYHDVGIDAEKIKSELRKYGFYEHFPLAIKKCE